MGWKFYNSTGQLLTAPASTSSAATADLATEVTITANNSTAETVYPVFIDGATGTQGLESDTGLTYNPNTGVLTTTQVTGNLTGNVTGNTSGTAGSTTGNAATATALASARTIGGVSFDGTGNITLPGVNSAGNQATSGLAATATLAATTTALASARTIGGVSFDGTGNITLPGVNSSGNQNTSGTAAGLSATLAVASGGTNLSSYTTGDIVYASGSTALSKLNKGDEDQVLTMGGSNAPTWATPSAGVGLGLVIALS